jgi:replicative DNA helicase
MSEPAAVRPTVDPVAEQVVLSGMLLSDAVADQVSGTLTADDFAGPANAEIFAAIVRALMLGEPTSVEGIGSALHATGRLATGPVAEAGGGAYLESLATRADIPTDAVWSAQKVREYAQLRRMDAALVRAHLAVRTPGASVADVAEQVQRAVVDATADSTADDGLKPASDVVWDVIERIENVALGKTPSGLTSGLGSLDEVTGKWQRGQLIVPAGRPGMGKTVAAMGFVKACVRAGLPALFFSTEMLAGELHMRLLADVGSINHEKLRRGLIDDEDRARLGAAATLIAQWPLYVTHSVHDTATIRAASRRFRQQHGDLGMVAVDYVQRLRPTQKFDRNDLEIGQHARDLKWLAVDLETVVVAVCQLNRNTEGRSDKRPALSDLRGSGELEQEADLVILLHREDAYDPESPKAGEAEFIVAKNRAGRCETVDVAAQLHLCRFSDMGIDDPTS